MLAHYTYAVIYDNKVQNIMVCEDINLANRISMATYGEDAFAIEVSYISCAIGDRYDGGKFYHTNESGEEVEVEAVPNEKEEIATLKTQTQSITLVLADLIGGATNE